MHLVQLLASGLLHHVGPLMRRCSVCGTLGHTKRTCARRATDNEFEWEVVMQQGERVSRMRADVDFLLAEGEMLAGENAMLWTWLYMLMDDVAEVNKILRPKIRTLASFSTLEGSA